MKFFEYFDDGAGGTGYWEDFGIFQESDVHHQYGIVFKTPAYRKTSIDSAVDVKVQLYRPKDKVTSEPHDFRYKPNERHGPKRKRIESSDIIPTVVGSHESSSHDNTAGSFYGSCQEAPDSFGPKFNRGGHHETNQEEELLSLDDSMMKIDFNTFPLSPEDLDKFFFSRQDDGLGDKLETDAVCSRRPTTSPLAPHDLNYSALDKLKMLIKLFKNNFDEEKLHDMMRVLIDAQDKTGENILLDCIAHGSKEDIKDLVLILLKYKLMDVLKSVNDLDRNCLHILILVGYSNLLKVFINLGAEVNQVDAFGQTPLHLAVVQGDTESVNELLSGSNSVALNELDDNGLTALHIASANDNLLIVRLLVAAGADDMKQVPTSGNNVLHMALARTEPNLKMITCLIDGNEELLYQENYSLKNALQLASGRKLDEEIIKYLASFYDESFTNKLRDQEDESTSSESDNDETTCFDERCINELCGILDKDNKWKEVAFLLELIEKCDEWEMSESPTRSLFHYLQVEKYNYSVGFLILILTYCFSFSKPKIRSIP